jgi:hypothetical protein
MVIGNSDGQLLLLAVTSSGLKKSFQYCVHINSQIYGCLLDETKAVRIRQSRIDLNNVFTRFELQHTSKKRLPVN